MSEADPRYSWSPDPDTGLSGDAYLSVAIEDHAPSPSEAHTAGIYVLELSTPDTTSHEAYARLWLEEFETVPTYLKTIAETPKLLYVGAAKDVYDRIRSHIQGHQSTKIAKVFPVHSIRYIKWCESPEIAFRKENSVAMDLANSVDGYVHSR